MQEETGKVEKEIVARIIKRRITKNIFFRAELRKRKNENVRNLLGYLVLRLLRNQPMHGYGILSTIRKRYGYYPAPSTIYQLLSTFENKKYIKSTLEVRNRKLRKVYDITPEGIATLNLEEKILNHIINFG